MRETFWFGYTIEKFLFSELNITTVGGLVGTCVCILLMAIIFEFLRFGLARIKLHSNCKPPRWSSENTMLINTLPSTKKKRWLWFTAEMSLYTLEVILGYFLMLIVMTFNGYIFLTILVGAGLGYGMIGSKLAAVRLKASKLRLPCSNCARDVSRASSRSTNLGESETGNPCCSGHGIAQSSVPTIS